MAQSGESKGLGIGMIRLPEIRLDGKASPRAVAAAESGRTAASRGGKSDQVPLVMGAFDPEQYVKSALSQMNNRRGSGSDSNGGSGGIGVLQAIGNALGFGSVMPPTAGPTQSDEQRAGFVDQMRSILDKV